MVVVKQEGVCPWTPAEIFVGWGGGKPKKGSPYVRTKKGPYIQKKVAKRLQHEEKVVKMPSFIVKKIWGFSGGVGATAYSCALLRAPMSVPLYISCSQWCCKGGCGGMRGDAVFL